MAPALDFIDVFPEPLFAAAMDGRVLRVNAACRTALGLPAVVPPSLSLAQLVTDSTEQLGACMRQWARSTSFTPAALTFRRGRLEPVRYICEGARHAPDTGAPILLLRLRRRGEANRKFMDLTRQLVELETEVVRRMRAEERLVEADRRKDEFLATMAHELRNPLAPILSSLELLRLAPNPAGMLERWQSVVERQVKQLVRLVDDLLEASRWTRGVVELRRQVVALSEVARHAVATSDPLVAAKGHTLAVKRPPQELFVYGDSERLVQAFSNLLNNAAKYTPPGGRIAFVLEKDGDQALVRVSDNGIGIPPDMLEHVFDLFVRGTRSPAGTNGGLGIGLTLVRQIVEAHGGSVRAHSRGADGGSEFVLRLPLHQPGKQGPAPTPTPQRSHRSVRALIVDDHSDAADSLAAMLGMMGHDVRVTYSGADALAVADEFAPDVVFLDIGMPGMDGYETCRQLRAREQSRRALIVALTGFGQESDRVQSRAAGFDEHLVKPAPLDALRRVLAKVPAAALS